MFMESASVVNVGWLAILALAMMALLAIPLVVILLVHPKTRAGLASLARFLGWVAGCIVFVALFGYFFVGSWGSPPNAPHVQSVRVVSATSSTSAPEQGPDSFALDHPIEPHSSGGSAVGTPPAELSQPVSSGQRPEWLDWPAGRHEQTHVLAVKSGLWSTAAECRAALDGAIAKGVEQYLVECFGDQQAALAQFDPAQLRPRLVKRPIYAETVEASVGPMLQWHALLEFDNGLRAELQRLVQAGAVSQRLRWAGSGFALVLAALAASFAHLKLDLATGGQYRGRLRWATGLAILLMAAGAVGICVL